MSAGHPVFEAPQQLLHWAAARLVELGAGLREGCAGPAMGLAIQAQLPAHSAAAAWAEPLNGNTRASRAASLMGVQA